ncbi:MAG: hypothetical protein LIR50_01155 [Bacillota bacterium]|nr:hypothetical protein [Bacillota bacterium]
MNKYGEYKVQIVNNQTGKIIENELTIKSKSYNDILSFYNQAKYQYRDQDITVSVLGFNKDKVVTRFQKIFHSPKINNIIIEDEKRDSIYDQCQELSNNINKFVQGFYDNKNILGSLIGAYKKKEDMKSHLFDNLEKKNKYELTQADIDQRVDITLDIQSIRSYSRDLKNEQTLINMLYTRKMIEKLKKINSEIQTQKNMVQYTNNKIARSWAKKEVNINKKYTEVPYKNFKERVKIIAKLERTFDKVTYDENKKLIIAYNKCLNSQEKTKLFGKMIG